MGSIARRGLDAIVYGALTASRGSYSVNEEMSLPTPTIRSVASYGSEASATEALYVDLVCNFDVEKNTNSRSMASAPRATDGF